jgi:anti-sigma B factor antagonist
MRLRTWSYDGACICGLEGSLEEVDVPAFLRALAALPRGGGLVFDLRLLDYVSSAGLGALVGAVRRSRQGGGDAVLCRPTPAVARALNMTLLPRFVPVVDTLDEATSWLCPSRAA